MASRDLSRAAIGVVRGKPFTINCQPSWRTQAEWCLAGLENGSEAAKAASRTEIRRMGDLIDKLLAERGQ